LGYRFYEIIFIMENVIILNMQYLLDSYEKKKKGRKEGREGGRKRGREEGRKECNDLGVSEHHSSL
jgi:flagellar biosynthesis/type III secretory pathway protein FliH